MRARSSQSAGATRRESLTPLRSSRRGLNSTLLGRRKLLLLLLLLLQPEKRQLELRKEAELARGVGGDKEEGGRKKKNGVWEGVKRECGPLGDAFRGLLLFTSNRLLEKKAPKWQEVAPSALGTPDILSGAAGLGCTCREARTHTLTPTHTRFPNGARQSRGEY